MITLRRKRSVSGSCALCKCRDHGHSHKTPHFRSLVFAPPPRRPLSPFSANAGKTFVSFYPISAIPEAGLCRLTQLPHHLRSLPSLFTFALHLRSSPSLFTFALICEGDCLVQGIFVPSDEGGSSHCASVGTFPGTRQCQPLMFIKRSIPTIMASDSQSLGCTSACWRKSLAL